MRKTFVIIFMLNLILFPVVIHANTDRTAITRTVDEMEAVNKNGRLLVPLRKMTDITECTVDWNSNTKTAAIKHGPYIAEFVIGSVTYTINGIPHSVDTPPEIINDRTYVPLRAAAESIGAEINYNINNKTVTIENISNTSEVNELAESAFNETDSLANETKKAIEKIVVIDAGHGGEDKGAVVEQKTTVFDPVSGENITYDQLCEKDLTLFLAKAIEKNAGTDMKVYLIRSEDKKISLEDASNFANEMGGVCVSLHYSFVPEYTAEQSDISGIASYYYNGDAESKKLAEILQQNLISGIQTKDRGIEEANLYMLREVNSPAVSIEMGIINNSEDLEIISGKNYIETVANLIIDGLNHYFTQSL